MIIKLILSQIFFFFLTSSSILASLPGFYGSSTSSSSLANQATYDFDDPANAYYIPALSAYTQNIVIDLNTQYIKTQLNEINNIVVKNSINGQSGSTTEIGSPQTDYDPSFHLSLNLLLPILNKDSGTLAISYFGPIGTYAETNSGDPFLPEYVLYRSRYSRTQIHLNYAYPINNIWAFSIGGHLGFQASAKVDTKVSLSNDQGSYASASTKISPSIAAILSLVRKSENHHFYLTYQQEMKSNLETTTTGDITNPPLTLIDISLATMLYYDPHIFRLGFSSQLNFLDFFATIEYQMWGKYKSPIITIQNKGGSVRSSSNYEAIELRDIFIPKIGMTFSPSDSLSISTGLAYRPSPLKGDFSGNGNSIDSNSFILATGISYDLKLFSKEVSFGFSTQYHKLIEKDVIKSANQEDGSTGQKIGSPGYKVGGSVISLQSGIKIKF